MSFVRSALKLYQTVGGGTEDFVIELLTEFLEAEPNHRSYLRSILIEQGLQVRQKKVFLRQFFPYNKEVRQC